MYGIFQKAPRLVCDNCKEEFESNNYICWQFGVKYYAMFYIGSENPICNKCLENCSIKPIHSYAIHFISPTATFSRHIFLKFIFATQKMISEKSGQFL